MIKNILCFLSIFFVFVFNIACANETYKPYNILVNGIPVSKDVAYKIFDDAKKDHIDIHDAKKENIKIDVVTEGADVIINGRLMDEVGKLYHSNEYSYKNRAIGCQESKDRKIAIYVSIKDEKKGEIKSIEIED